MPEVTLGHLAQPMHWLDQGDAVDEYHLDEYHPDIQQTLEEMILWKKGIFRKIVRNCQVLVEMEDRNLCEDVGVFPRGHLRYLG